MVVSVAEVYHLQVIATLLRLALSILMPVPNGPLPLHVINIYHFPGSRATSANDSRSVVHFPNASSVPYQRKGDRLMGRKSEE